MYINRCWLFYAISCFYIYIEYIEFDLVGFYGISTIVGYSKPYSVFYIYIKYIGFGLVWFGFMAYQPLLVIQSQILFLHMY